MNFLVFCVYAASLNHPDFPVCIVSATGGRYTRGWPGDTQERLTKLGVQLRVRANDLNVTPDMFCGSLGKMWDLDIQYLQVAIGEGWFELTGPERTENTVEVIGAVPDPVNNNSINKDQSTAHTNRKEI